LGNTKKMCKDGKALPPPTHLEKFKSNQTCLCHKPLRE